MSKSILDKKFAHKYWWKNTNLTKRQMLEWAASTKAKYNGIYLLQKKSAIKNDNLFEPLEYKYYYVLKSDEGGSYRLSEEEYNYYIERKAFWDKWIEEEKQVYPDDIYNEYWKILHNAMMRVPEYADFWNNANII